MINYVWLALIVIAVLYGGYNDLRKRPMSHTPDAVAMVPRDGASAAWEISLDQPQPLDLTIDGKYERTDVDGQSIRLAPQALALTFQGGEAGALVEARFTNTRGQLFAAAVGTLKGGDVDTRHIIPLAGLTPLAENPVAKVEFPLTLSELRVTAPAGVEATGSLRMTSAELTFPTQALLSSAVASSSWMGVLTKSSARWAFEAIDLAIKLIGIMMLWLGLMKIAEEAGLVRLIARGLRPIMTRLFPEIPPDSDAMGAIVMNISANMLGLGNAATPLGLKAMQELQELNEHKEYASNAMCMLLALNTSSVTLITPAIIGFRVASGSDDIMKFWPVMIAVTVGSTISGVLACKILERLPIFRIPPEALASRVKTEEATS